MKFTPIILLVGLASYFIYFKTKTKNSDPQYLKISIIDTFMCPNVHLKSDHITLKPWGHRPSNCHTKLMPFKQAFHADYILNHLLKTLREFPKQEVIIEHHNIYQNNGVQSKDLWLKALKRVAQFSPHLLIMTTLAPKKWSNELSLNDESLIIAATPTQLEIRSLNQNFKYIWPLNTKAQNILQVATLKEFRKRQKQKSISHNVHNVSTLSSTKVPTKAHFDTSSAQVGLIDFFLWEEESKNGFRGTSFAATKTAQLVIKYCTKKLLQKSVVKINSCLKGLSSPVEIVTTGLHGIINAKMQGRYYNLLSLKP